ncbi:tail fiber domain-containing protein [Phaeobacter inhibens]|uniref:tail fiber domain-containing protein n=1 Tax=Phaeobacter inhibens TaxID=221822 RepID=UPI0018F498D2|nr:tail fiber domain-containing protein [Phaeobacter inhibens]
MTATTNVMRNATGPNQWGGTFGRLSQTSAPVVQAASANLGEARQGLSQGIGFQEGQIASTDLGQYQNPYQQQVIDNATGDLNRARQMTQNDIGAQATAAGAFGGSRHGLVEAENNRNFAESVSDMAAQQRMAGFNNAQGMAQQDIANRMQGQQMRTGAASQLGGLNLANAQRRDQVSMANAQNQLANDRNQLAAAQAGQSRSVQNKQLKLQAAGQLAGMGGQAFNQSNQINQQMAQNGAMQQAMQQQLINAGKGQFAGWTGAPQNALNLPLMAVGAAPNVGTQTTTQSGGGSGLMDALGFGASLLPFLSDRRAKEDIRRVGQTDSGLPIYTYRYKGGDTFHMGVMAQEVEAVQPEAVVERPDGLKAVRYDLIEA